MCSLCSVEFANVWWKYLLYVILVIHITYSAVLFQLQRIKQNWNFKYHLKVKKVKFSLEQATKTQRRGISSTLYLTSALDGYGWSKPSPGCFTPGNGTQYHWYTRLGGPQGRSGWVWKISLPPGFDPLIVQTTASRFADWVIPAHLNTINVSKIIRNGTTYR